MRVLVVGSGIAGLTAALHAAESGHRVTLFTKADIGGGCTALAQGGIAGLYGPSDSASVHAEDTLAAGAYLGDPRAIDVLVGEGSARIRELARRGVAFDRAANGEFLRGTEAAHAFPRIVHAGGDATGRAISDALVTAVRSADIEVIERAFLVDLVTTSGAITGIRIIHDDTLVEHSGDTVILATGGAGALYAHTTNPADSTGDGIAAALRAGAAVADLEFVQFHPTVLADGPAFLISEAVRGEGATLIDDAGRRFAFDAHPAGELAPRDVVSRAIATQAARQGSSVRLDATALSTSFLRHRFPTIDGVTRARGFDWSREPIPVTPAAHYSMGGIVTDVDGRTSLPGLWAVGETARTGVHGANRLASNSLLEGVVFAARAVASLDRTREFSAVEALPSHRARTGDPVDRQQLQQLMWDNVGLLRTDDGLAEALRRILAWSPLVARSTDVAAHEDANLLSLAEATCRAALRRRESVGAHHRSPSPALIGA